MAAEILADLISIAPVAGTMSGPCTKGAKQRRLLGSLISSKSQSLRAGSHMHVHPMILLLNTWLVAAE